MLMIISVKVFQKFSLHTNFWSVLLVLVFPTHINFCLVPRVLFLFKVLNITAKHYSYSSFSQLDINQGAAQHHHEQTDHESQCACFAVQSNPSIHQRGSIEIKHWRCQVRHANSSQTNELLSEPGERCMLALFQSIVWSSQWMKERAADEDDNGIIFKFMKKFPEIFSQTWKSIWGKRANVSMCKIKLWPKILIPNVQENYLSLTRGVRRRWILKCELYG